jgi:rhodanese-related sulfurtransferase
MNKEHVVQRIDVDELKKHYDNDKPFYLIDVRELSEWDEGHIPGATHIPKDVILEKIGSVVSDKSCPIFLHCRGGTRSLHAGESLLEIGFKKVYSIDGGIMDWQAHGYPVKNKN